MKHELIMQKIEPGNLVRLIKGAGITMNKRRMVYIPHNVIVLVIDVGKLLPAHYKRITVLYEREVFRVSSHNIKEILL
jgi:hypothetical protein